MKTIDKVKLGRTQLGHAADNLWSGPHGGSVRRLLHAINNCQQYGTSLYGPQAKAAFNEFMKVMKK